jgi:riboflavin biosynthesis pyrimidine reductase
VSVVAAAERTAIEPLFSAPADDGRPASSVRGGHLPTALRERYGSDLTIPLRADRPTVVANFVGTLDGVVSFNTPEAPGGGEISGFFEPDRFVMGLLRALSDAVLIGAGTLRAASGRWTPASVHPASAADFAQVRQSLGLAPHPTTIVLTASGDIAVRHRGLADETIPVLVLTTERGRDRLARAAVRSHVEIEAAGTERVAPAAVINSLARRGMSLVLSEAGPHVFGQLLAAGLVDELFLTIAPQLAGRGPDTSRLGLVEGTAFNPSATPWARLVDVRRSGSHLFTRYLFEGASDAGN